MLVVWLWVNESLWWNTPIDSSLCRCWGIVDIPPPPSDTCFLILDSAVSRRVPISGHLAEQPTSSKWPRNLGGKHQPRRQSLAKSWLKPQNFRGWGSLGCHELSAMRAMWPGDQARVGVRRQSEPERGKCEEREGKAETITSGAAAVVKLLERCCNRAVNTLNRVN